MMRGMNYLHQYAQYGLVDKLQEAIAIGDDIDKADDKVFCDSSLC